MNGKQNKVLSLMVFSPLCKGYETWTSRNTMELPVGTTDDQRALVRDSPGDVPKDTEKEVGKDRSGSRVTKCAHEERQG